MQCLFNYFLDMLILVLFLVSTFLNEAGNNRTKITCIYLSKQTWKYNTWKLGRCTVVGMRIMSRA